MFLLVPGEWMAWGEWGLCSKTCGGGVRMRTRECNMTTYGDLTSPCIGKNLTTKECHTFSCQSKVIISIHIQILAILQ